MIIIIVIIEINHDLTSGLKWKQRRPLAEANPGERTGRSVQKGGLTKRVQ
jgi:hypothetical protein